MASSLFLSLLFTFVVCILSSNNATANPIVIQQVISADPAPKNLILQISKDDATKQYYTIINIGKPTFSFKAVIDLGGPFLWLNCDTSSYNSPTYAPVDCDSAKCQVAGGSGCVGCSGPARPGCTNNTCGIYPYNPFIPRLLAGGLGEDALTVTSALGPKQLSTATVNRFPLACADEEQINGLAGDAQGMVGLAKTLTSLPTQLSSTFNVSRKFALCLPSPKVVTNTGDIFVGGYPNYLTPYRKDVSEALIRTPLVINPVSTAPIYSEGDASYEYFIGVKSVKVDGEVLSINPSLFSFDKFGVGGTKLSTIDPYTVLNTKIYKALVKSFSKKTSLKKIAKATPVKPFEACFKSATIGNTQTGPDVPVIELGLQNNVQWKIYGNNTMVKVSKDVMCLAFVDGGKEPRTSIVIGGHQLEDNLLEFDHAASTFGFTSSLLLQDSDCSSLL